LRKFELSSTRSTEICLVGAEVLRVGLFIVVQWRGITV
jgi:hypothetical protein